MCCASGTVTRWAAPPRRCRSDSSVRLRSPPRRPADRRRYPQGDGDRRGRRRRRPAVRPGRTLRDVLARTRTKRRRAARSGAPCRRCGDAVGDSGLLDRPSPRRAGHGPAVVDLVQVERLGSSSRLADLERAAALARGPFLAGFSLRDSPTFDDWQAARSARVERMVADLLDRLAEARLAAGDTPARWLPHAGGSTRTRSTSQASAGSSSCWPGRATATARSASTGRWSRSSTGSSAWPRCERRRNSTSPSATTEDRSPRLSDRPTDSARPVRRGASQRRPDVRRREWPIVGRDRELAVLVEAWRSGRDGRRRGRHRRRGWDRQDASRRGARGVDPGAGGVVLVPVVTRERRGSPTDPSSSLSAPAWLDPTGPTACSTLDSTARLELSRSDRPSGGTCACPGDPGPRRRARGSACSMPSPNSLTALSAGPAPGLVWIDDLHLADEPTRESVVYLAHRLTGRPAGPRRGLAAGGPQRRWSRLGGRPRADPRCLPGLARSARSTGHRGDRPDARPEPIDDAFIDVVADESEGLPLYLVEALAASDPSDVPRRWRRRSAPARAHRIGRSDGGPGAVERLGHRTVVRSRDRPLYQRPVRRRDRRGARRADPTRTGPRAARRACRHARATTSATVGCATRRTTGPASPVAGYSMPGRRTPSGSTSPTTGRDDLARYALIAIHEREAGRPGPAAEAFCDAADRARGGRSPIERRSIISGRRSRSVGRTPVASMRGSASCSGGWGVSRGDHRAGDGRGIGRPGRPPECRDLAWADPSSSRRPGDRREPS